MPEFKLTINDVKTGRSFQKTVSGTESDIFRGKKIKDTVDGSSFGMKGYELQVTGGSDSSGFPMRFDIDGQGRKRPLLTRGPCVKIKRKGMKKRKTVVGNSLSASIIQINLKITKYGQKSVNEIFGVEEKKEETKEVKEEEKPKEEIKETPKESEKKVEVKKEVKKLPEKKEEAPVKEPKKEQPKSESKKEETKQKEK